LPNDAPVVRTIDRAIWESQDAKALTDEPGVALGITRRIMERPIRLDDQAVTEANEVHNEGTDGKLPSELDALQAAIAQQPPERALSRRCALAQSSSLLDGCPLRGGACATPHPARYAGHLLPQGEKDRAR
jgi:hypothetical protein